MSNSFCALPESLEGVERASMRQWARGHEITWAVERPVAGFSREKMAEVCLTAMELWEGVSGVRTVQTTGMRPNVLITTQRIDGPAGVLAQAELPGANHRSGTLRCWFDTGDSWVLAVNPPRGKMDLLRVACHEFGHNLGMGHAPASSPNLMAPTVSSIREPMPGWDIPQVVARYGEQSSVPQPEPQPGDDDAVLLECLAEFLRGFSRTERLRIARQLSDVAKDVLRAWGDAT